MATTKKAARRAPRRAKKSRARRIWGRIGVSLLVLFIIGGITGLGSFLYLYSTTHLPNPNEDFTTNTTFLYYEDGRNQMGSLAVQNRVTIPYEQMPQLMKDAVVAAENRSFWEDPGFSVTGMLRGAWSILRGGEVQGGSTITQQYIKIFYLDSSRTIQRKVRELFLATKMGREVPKEEILEGYLNTIYFGRGAYGIQAAAKSYFLKDSKDLTVGEAAALAAILNNPAGFNPSGGQEKLDRLLGRYQYVLDGMLEMGAISQAEYDAARPSLPEFPVVPVNNRYGGPKGFLIKMVEDELADKGFTEAEIQGGGLKVITTVHKPMQEAAIQEAQKYTAQAAADASGTPDPSKLHVAISSVDTATGGILALYGGPDYVENSLNWATRPRAAASTFKTFATIAGLRNGFSLKSVLKGDTFTPRGDTQPVRNEFHHQYGDVTLRKATADSVNTAFVDLTEQMPNGQQEVIKAANDAGAPTGPAWESSGNRIALGFGEVSPLNMANAYATLANSGKRNPTHIVKQVIDRNGEVVYDAVIPNAQTIDPNVAANVTDSLRSVVQEGTGRRAQSLGRPVAGKTGTNGVDDAITTAWFVGYTKQISTAVMYVAGDDGNQDLQPYKRPGDRTFYGSSYPLMTWVDFMARASEGMEELNFDKPQEIQAERGKVAETPRATQSAESESPSPSPSPTIESPSPSPSAEPTATPTPSVTLTPTPEPTPTPTPTPTPELTPTEDLNAAPGAQGDASAQPEG
ncbi:MAG: transglycosylase domain-containing protein [Propionibacteriaceae bacterium]|nr:transglycosylase domain-containing protein [Propionibacteriaceae bacterium]